MRNSVDLMRFSLIMATINRTDEVLRLLKSLNEQSYKNFELIIVDQNNDDRIDAILQNNKLSFHYIHLKSEKGLSKARNIGLKHISGDIVCFPDDDCEYSKETLEQARSCFKNNEVDGVVGVLKTLGNKKICNVSSFYRENSDLIDFKDIFMGIGSAQVFYKKEVFLKIGNFDEYLGAGTDFGSGEDGDILVRAMSNKCKLYFNGEVEIFHPDLPLNYNDPKLSIRFYNYSKGRGALFKKYIIDSVNYSILWIFIEEIFRLGLSTVRDLFINYGRSKVKMKMLLGYIYGFRKYKHLRKGIRDKAI